MPFSFARDLFKGRRSQKPAPALKAIFSLLLIAFPLVVFAAEPETQYHPRKAIEERQRQKALLKKQMQDREVRLKALAESAEPVYILAKRQSYDRRRDLFILDGAVEIRQGDFSLIADRVTLNRKTGDLEAIGDLVVNFERDRITGSRAVYNIRNKTCTIIRARGVIEPSIYFDAELIERLPPDPKTGENRYWVVRGEFSACESNPIPDWKIRSAESEAHLNHYLRLTHPRFYIWKIPVIYSPWWLHPIRPHRTTGLLIPSVGHSNKKGAHIRNGFFWAVTDNFDATFYHDWYEKAGNGAGLEVHYAFDPLSAGDFEGWYVRERPTYLETESDEDLPSDRGEIEFRHRDRLLDWMDMRARVDYRTDDKFSGDYTRTYKDRYMNSYLNFSKSWGHQSAQLSFIRYEDTKETHLGGEDSTSYAGMVSGSQPRIRYRSGLQEIAASDFHYEITLQGDQLYRKSFERRLDWNEAERYFKLKSEHARMDATAKLSYVWRGISWISITPFAQVQETWWGRRKSANPWPEGQSDTWLTTDEERCAEESEGLFEGVSCEGKGLRRDLYSLGVDFKGPRFYRIIDFGWGDMEKFKHSVTPGVQYQYAPSIDQRDIISVENSIDNVPARNEVTWSITNLFLGRYPLGSEQGVEEDETLPCDTPFELKSIGPYDIVGDKGIPDSEKTENGYRKAAGRKSRTRSLGMVRLKQTYRFLNRGLWDEKMREFTEDNSNPYPSFSDREFSDILLEVELNPLANLGIDSDLKFDPYSGRFRRKMLATRCWFGPYFGSVRWNIDFNAFDYYDSGLEAVRGWPDDDRESLTSELGGRFGKRWSGFFSAQYDLEDDIFNKGRLEVFFDEKCWGLTLIYDIHEAFNLSTAGNWDKDIEHEVAITFYLKHIGDVGRTHFRPALP